MPPDPREWLPEGHVAWFVLASVEEMDLSAIAATNGVTAPGSTVCATPTAKR